MIKIIKKYEALEGSIRSIKEEEVIGGHLRFDITSWLRTQFSTSLVTPGQKPSGVLLGVGRKPNIFHSKISQCLSEISR